MSSIASFQKVHAGSGEISLRNAVVLAFFVQRPTHEIADQVSALLDAYLAAIPPDAIKWAVASSSAEEWRPLAKTTIANCKKQLAPAGSKTRDITSFHLSDVEGQAPSHGFDFTGRPKGPKYKNTASVIQMTFPIDVVSAERVGEFFQAVLKFSGMVDFSYGYCSPALLYSELRRLDAYNEMRGLAMRHHGYDVNANGVSAWNMADETRGARWITLLGPNLLKQLGGLKALKGALKNPSISITEIGSGVLVRAGETPELGDTNRKVGTPLLREVAKVLEPVTHFGEKELIFNKMEPGDPFVSRWERRFLD